MNEVDLTSSDFNAARVAAFDMGVKRGESAAQAQPIEALLKAGCLYGLYDRGYVLATDLAEKGQLVPGHPAPYTTYLLMAYAFGFERGYENVADERLWTYLRIPA